MIYIENWNTEEVITRFTNEESCLDWLAENTYRTDLQPGDDGYTPAHNFGKRVLKSDPSVRISIYETKYNPCTGKYE